jgi:hypothetical protein
MGFPLIFDTSALPPHVTVREIWSPKIYDEVHGTSDPNAFYSLATKVMKGIRNSGS